MLRFSDLSPSVQAAIVILVLSFYASIIVLMSMIIALGGLGRLFEPWSVERLPYWFWYFRAEPQVQLWFGRGLMISLGLSGLVIGRLALNAKRPLHGEATWASAYQIARAGLRDKEGVVLGHRHGSLLRSGGEDHVLVCAPTRSGKSTGVVIPTLLSWGGSAVVLDIKGEVWNATAGWRASIGHEVWRFDPLSKEGRTHCFNPLGHINRNHEGACERDLDRIAQLLFPSDGRDQFWAEASRSAFVAVGLYVAQSKGLTFSIGEIARQFQSGDLKQRLNDLASDQEAFLAAACRRLLLNFTSTSENTFHSIRQTVSSRLHVWTLPQVDWATSSSSFSLIDLRRRRSALYLTAPAADLEQISAVFNLILQQLLDATRSEGASSGSVPLLVMMDEFASLGRMPSVARSFAWVGGYGVRLVCIVQAHAQLRSLYGDDGAEEIAANCNVKLYFAPAIMREARELSEVLGAGGQEAISRSGPSGFSSGRRTMNVSEQRRPLMLPQEILQLRREAVLILVRGFPPIRGKRVLWYKHKPFRDRRSAPPLVAEGLPLNAQAQPNQPFRPMPSASSSALSRFVDSDDSAALHERRL